MEIIRGKYASFLDTLAFRALLTTYSAVHIDIGTGDGHFVRHLAQADSSAFVIGIDACRENLHEVSRRAPANTLFVIANALALPDELAGAAPHVSINFPWGSLTEGLLAGDSALLNGLQRITQPQAKLDVRLNGGALAEAGYTLEAGAAQVQRVLADHGFRMKKAATLSASELKSFPTTWAKRLAFGRDPHAIHLSGVKI